MRETFYEQVRQEGVLINKEDKQEEWMVKGVTITFYFRDDEHRIIDVIII